MKSDEGNLVRSQGKQYLLSVMGTTYNFLEQYIYGGLKDTNE